jgi:hypothetical protein
LGDSNFTNDGSLEVTDGAPDGFVGVGERALGQCLGIVLLLRLNVSVLYIIRYAYSSCAIPIFSHFFQTLL